MVPHMPWIQLESDKVRPEYPRVAQGVFSVWSCFVMGFLMRVLGSCQYVIEKRGGPRAVVNCAGIPASLLAKGITLIPK